jgi:DNA-binding NarL/FixJ family response regulator
MRSYSTCEEWASAAARCPHDLMSSNNRPTNSMQAVRSITIYENYKGPPLVGRLDELTRIMSAMEDTRTSGLVLSGEMGMGKTRLALEAINRVDRDRHKIVWVVATRAASSIPFGAFAQYLPSDVSTTSGFRNPLRLAVESLVKQAATSRLVVAIDNTHLLDHASAVLVHQLACTSNAFVLLTFRDSEPVPDPIADLWKSGLVERIQLAPLTRLEVERILADTLNGYIDGTTIEMVWETTCGNPLILHELVAAGLESKQLTLVEGIWRMERKLPLTPRFAETIKEHLGSLEPEEQQVLELLVYGEPIGPAVLSRIASSQALEDVEAKHLLWVEQDGRRNNLRFTYPIHREFLRVRMPALRAWRHQRDLARLVGAMGARRAGDSLRIAEWQLEIGCALQPNVLVAGARQAWAALDLQLAVRLGRAALEGSRDPKAVWVLGNALLFTGHPAGAEAVFAEFSAVPYEYDEGDRTELTLGRAFVLFFGLDRVGTAMEILRETLPTVTDPSRRADLVSFQALFHAYGGESDLAARVAADVLKRSAPDTRAAAVASLARGVATLFLGYQTEAISDLNRARLAAETWVDQIPWLLEFVEVARCQAYLLQGNLSEATRIADSGYERAIARNWDFAVFMFCIVRGQTARARGMVRDALLELREGHRLSSQCGISSFVKLLLSELAHAAALIGDAATAEICLAEADCIAARSMRPFEPWVELARPWVVAARSGVAAGVECAKKTARNARKHYPVLFEALALHGIVRLGVPGLALGRLRELAVADHELVQLYAVHAAAAANNDGAALEWVSTAFEQMGATLFAAEAAAQASQAYRQQNNHLAQGWASAGRAALLGHRCENVSTPALELIEEPDLTSREREIANLAIAGLSTLEIATQLVISVRTVDNHLQRIYRKLGISSRSELATLLGPFQGDEA